MMIECKPLRATVPESTCISRQKLIKEKDSGARGVGYGMMLDQCSGCEIGLNLLKGEKPMVHKMKRCSRKTCLKIHPATTEFFGVNKQNKDGLSYYCRACQAEMSKESYAKKNNPEALKHEPKDANLPAAEKSIKKPELSAKEKPEQICTDCGKALPATTEFFHKDGNGKLRGDCKDCRAKNRKGDSRIITLDLKDVPDLVEKITTWAKQQRRIPAQQIIFHLEELLGCKECAGL